MKITEGKKKMTIEVMNPNSNNVYYFADSTGWRNALVSTALMESNTSVTHPDMRPKFDSMVKLTKFGATLNGWWVKRLL